MIRKSKWFAFQERDEDYETVKTKDYGKIPKSPFRGLRSVQTAMKEFKSEERIFKVHVIYKPKGCWYKEFEQLNLVKSKKDLSFTELLMPNGGAIMEPGKPMLPTEGLYVALPLGATFKEIKNISFEEKKFDAPIDILPAPIPTKDNGEEWIPPEYIPDEKIYESDETFPGEIVKVISKEDNKMGDVPVVHMMVYPLRYKPKSRELIVLNKIELDVFYTPAGKRMRRFRGAPGSTTIKLRSPRQTIRHEIQDQILNIEAADEDVAFDEEGEVGILTDGGEEDVVIPEEYGPLSDIKNEGRYIIITKNDLLDTLKPFVKIKKDKGYTVKTITDEEIYREFGSRKKDVSIRKFLKYAYDNWEEPPEYVLIVGDVDRIPTHRDERYDCASDYYYACLTDDVNPDILLGRIAIDKVKGLENYIDKCMKFDKLTSRARPQSWQLRVLLTAYNRYDYIECSDDCAEILESERRAKVIKKYDGQAAKSEIVKEINSGVAIVNYRGHGDTTEWQSGNGLDLDDVKNLKNGDKTPVVFSIACLNSYIDNPQHKDCFGEMFVEAKDGAIGFLGASRPSYTAPNHHFNRYLFRAVVEKDLKKVGEIFSWATMQLWRNFPDQYSKENITMYLWLGDPDIDLSPSL